jgi:uncharacterized small protein (DUF1192 family)
MIALALALLCQADVFSGPQKGEKLPSFKVLDMTGGTKGKEVDVAPRGPALVVFIHEATRPAAQVLRALDQAAAARPGLASWFVLLAEDMNAAEQRVPAMQGSLKFRTPWGISVDGKEGPGALGLNKAVTLTVLLAKDGVVQGNWAITSPSDVDAPPIVKAIDALVPADRVAELEARVAALEREVAQLKQQTGGGMAARPARPASAGKAPADAALNGAMRRVIRRDAADADVDAALKEIDERARSSAELKQEAIDGFTLLVDLKYGGDYAQKRLKEALEALKK